MFLYCSTGSCGALEKYRKRPSGDHSGKVSIRSGLVMAAVLSILSESTRYRAKSEAWQRTSLTSTAAVWKNISNLFIEKAMTFAEGCHAVNPTFPGVNFVFVLTGVIFVFLAMSIGVPYWAERICMSILSGSFRRKL